jgi:SAM-dependent methyltransferase
MDPRHPDYWNQIYAEEPRPGWDMDGATPLLEEALGRVAALGLSVGPEVAVPGCGYGHDAAALAAQGFTVTAFDFAPRALEGARARYGEVARWLQEDWFETAEGPFDVVWDHTCFVAMAPERRADYIARTARLLKPGGLWLGAFFHSVAREPGPPFALSQEELRVLATQDFDLRDLGEAMRSHPRRAGREFLAIGVRRV